MSAYSAGETHVDGGTLLTVPIGEAWGGSISLSACLTAALNTSGGTALPYVSVTGDQHIADGTRVAELCLGVPVVNLLALIGVSNNSVMQQDLELTAGAEVPVTLTLNFGGATLACAVATGDLV